jgi:hypothetical protein
MSWVSAANDGCRFGCRRTSKHQLNIDVDKNIFYIILKNLSKLFNSGLDKAMCKAAHPSGGMDSSNPRHQRGWWLHHHGGGVSCVFVCVVSCLVVVTRHTSKGTRE